MGGGGNPRQFCKKKKKKSVFAGTGFIEEIFTRGPFYKNKKTWMPTLAIKMLLFGILNATFWHFKCYFLVLWMPILAI